MNILRILQISIYLLLISLFSNSQNLLITKNNPEFMCSKLEMISDFDNSSNFIVGDKDFFNNGQNHLEGVITIVENGLKESKCLEAKTSDFTIWGGTYYLECTREITLNNGEGIGVWFKSNRDVLTEVYFKDALGIVFSVPKKFIEGNTGWSYSYAVPESNRKTNDSVKETNHAITYPCRFLGFSLFPRDENTIIYLDEVAKVKEVEQSVTPKFSVVPQKLANVYLLNETVQVNTSSVADKLRIIIKNYNGKVISESTGDLTLQFNLPTNMQGYFEVLLLSYRDEIKDENLVNGKMFSYAVVKDETVLNERLGICSHPQRSYYHNECVDLMSLIGSKYMRIGMVLEFLETNDGSFVFDENTLTILNDARDGGFKFVCIFRDKIPPLTEELKQRFLKYSRFLLNEFNGVIDKVEFWNEWTNGTGTYTEYQSQQTAENYVDFVSSVFPVLKAEYPNVEFIGLGGENPQRFKDHIVEMFEAGAGNYMDAISLHPYRQPVAPGSRIQSVKEMTMAEQVLDIVDVAKEFNAPEKVYITEIGYPSHLLNNGLTDYSQAQYVIKTLGLLLTTNVVEQVDWYNLYDMDEIGTSTTYPKAEEYSQVNFGLFNGIKDNFAIKSGAMAYRFFAKITNGFDHGSQYDDGKGFFKLSLKDDSDGELEIMWDNFDQTQIRVDGAVTIFDMMGNVLDNNGAIEIGREPVYILKSVLSHSEKMKVNRDFKIYPNPTKENINIKLNDFEPGNNAYAELRTVNGMLVKEQQIMDSSTSIEVSSLVPGVYIVTIVSEDLTASEMVVINK